MGTGKASSIPLGVDLIEIKKVKRFYRTYKDRLKFFFSDREIRFIQQSRKPYESVGILLAAKEAAFKALPQKKIGIAAFRGIEILPASKSGTAIRLVKPLQKKKAKLSVLKNEKYVIVQCAGI